MGRPSRPRRLLSKKLSPSQSDWLMAKKSTSPTPPRRKLYRMHRPMLRDKAVMRQSRLLILSQIPNGICKTQRKRTRSFWGCGCTRIKKRL
ncbi:hypothetical protein C8R42DRAFT_687393 [Lentinula raphanica]|nr:hypothetical protein C8R42DRAFT_687393 [Lentinula raphanica]